MAPPPPLTARPPRPGWQLALTGATALLWLAIGIDRARLGKGGFETVAALLSGVLGLVACWVEVRARRR